MAKNLRGGTSHIHVSAQGACEINAISPPAPPPRSPAPGRAPAFARRPRGYVGRAPACEPCRARHRRASEFLLRQAASRRRPWRDRGQIVGQQLCLHVQIVFGLHVHEPLWIDLEETAEA